MPRPLTAPDRADDYALLTDVSAPDDRLDGALPHLPPMRTNQVFNGNSGNNTFTGGDNADVFNLFQGGNDKAYGGGGDDAFHFGHTFNTHDVVRGGDGTDTLFLAGDAYAGGLTITSGMLQGVEILGLTTDNSFSFTFTAGVFAGSAFFSVDGSAIGATHSLHVDSSAVSKGIIVYDSDGNDFFAGGSGDDGFISNFWNRPGTSGNDTFNGGGGNDNAFMYGALTAGDHIDGGSGSDTLHLNGDYAGGVNLGTMNLTSIEGIDLEGDHDYDLTTADANDTSTLIINGSAIGAGHSMTVDASAETDSEIYISDSLGNDTLTGGAHGDFFNLSGGDDTVYGGDGDNEYDFAGSFDKHDRVYGGTGANHIDLDGHYSLTVTGTMLKGIDSIILNSNIGFGQFDYSLKMADSVISGAGNYFFISAFTDAAHSVVVDASAETDASYSIGGGDGDDTLTGGAHADILGGFGGADLLDGGGGNDLFRYNGPVSDSTSSHYDTIEKFDTHHDAFAGLESVTGISHTVKSGDLSSGNFDADLSAALMGKLAAHHAVIFKPDGGGLDGSTFLIVDMNGSAAYEANQDFVIALSNAAHLTDLSLTNFGS